MLDAILSFSIRHRYLVVLFTLAAALLGFFSLRRLPIDAVPDITSTQVTVTTTAGAMSPEEVEKQVTFPIENALAGIPGLQSTRSLSRNGLSQVTAIFDDRTDLYFARTQVNERLLEAKEFLPPDVDPMMGPVSTGLSNVYFWALDFEHHDGKGADGKPLATAAPGEPGWQADGSYLTPDGERLTTDTQRATYLRTVQDWIITPQIRRIADVAGVDTLGGYIKQYQVRPDPMKLISYGFTLRDLTDALGKNNSSAGAGFIQRKGEAYLVRVEGRLEGTADIAKVPLGQHNGTPVLVGDVADVQTGPALRYGAASLNGREVVSGIALMRIGANSRTVAAAVDERIHQIGLPPDVRLRTILNRTRLVDSTIHTVVKNLAEGAILVVIILFLLLGHFRAALITALAIPISMLLTASGMVAGKISGNLMSLGAIDFGLIVDGAVIIVENCLRRLAERQRELGRPLTSQERLQTVLDASRQVRGATAFGEAIIMIVYLPILTLAGVEGRMFFPMAMTVILALAAAFVLSLTFVPAMVAIFVRGRVSERENPIVAVARRIYEPVLAFSLRHRATVVVTAVLLFAGSCALYFRLGHVFIPRLDEGDVNVINTRIPSTSLVEAVNMQEQVEQTLLQRMPEVTSVLSTTGTGDVAQDPIPQFEADTFISLKPPSEWRSEAELNARIEELEKQLNAGKKEAAGAKAEEADTATGADAHKALLVKLMKLELTAAVPGTAFEMSQPIEDRFNELIAGARSDVAVQVYGDRFEDMVPAAQQVAAILRQVRGAADVKVEQTEGLPVMGLSVDRAAAARYGLNVADVQDVVDIAVGGRKAGVIYEGDKRFELVVRLPDAARDSVAFIHSLPVPLPKSEPGAANTGRTKLASAAKDIPGMDFGGTGSSGSGRPGFVPLSAVTRTTTGEQQYEVTRENGKRHVLVQCNVRGRDLVSFVAEAQARVNQDVGARLKPGNWIEWGGQFENYAAARNRLAVVVPVALFLIFILLFATFGSVRDTVLVFSGVPLALTGGVLALWLRHLPFSISAGVGFIALSGVAVLNGLVMVTFINGLVREGLPVDEAVRRGSLVRLRPVLMTALVASLGFVPMAVATGAGAEVQRPLATVVIGGIISSTLLTLVVLPVLYRIAHRRSGIPTRISPARETVTA